MNKPPLLLLVHRIPYPPNKGDKIRSYHLLQHLRKHYRVFLGTFIDDPADAQHADYVRSLCEDACFISLNPSWRKLMSLRGLLNGQPLTLPYYASRELQRWVDRTVETHNIHRAIAFSSATAQFISGERFRNMVRVMDFIDIDSDKWAQYAPHKRFPMRQVYQREASRLLAYEQRIAAAFDASTFVSDHESELFRSLAPRSATRIYTVFNGVDLSHFKPAIQRQTPFAGQAEVKHLVFVGAMDYWPNEEAAAWFVNAVMPKLRKLIPVHFWIVGSKPPRSVQQLGEQADVTVTGRVDDVRDYLQHADLVVAPLRIARGIQNKVLEGMAMEKPVLVTSAALEGIPAEPNTHLALADTDDAFARAASNLLQEPLEAQKLAESGRRFVEQRFAWAQNLHVFDALLETPQRDPVNEAQSTGGLKFERSAV